MQAGGSAELERGGDGEPGPEEELGGAVEGAAVEGGAGAADVTRDDLVVDGAALQVQAGARAHRRGR